MDFVSHILIGRALATSPKNSRKNIYLITLFSFLPDLPQIPIYFYTDWDGFRALNPIWSALWEIPHSIFFVFLVIPPIILFFKLPKMAFIAYLSHIFVDLFTHAGEWGIKPFYPLPYQVNGLTNMWAWSFVDMLLPWFILLMAIVIFHFIRKEFSTGRSV